MVAIAPLCPKKLLHLDNSLMPVMFRSEPTNFSVDQLGRVNAHYISQRDVIYNERTDVTNHVDKKFQRRDMSIQWKEVPKRSLVSTSDQSYLVAKVIIRSQHRAVKLVIATNLRYNDRWREGD